MPDPLNKELLRNFGFPVSFPLNPLPPFSAGTGAQKKACKGLQSYIIMKLNIVQRHNFFLYKKISAKTPIRIQNYTQTLWLQDTEGFQWNPCHCESYCSVLSVDELQVYSTINGKKLLTNIGSRLGEKTDFIFTVVFIHSNFQQAGHIFHSKWMLKLYIKKY